jgi:hypothetical protein
MRRGIESCAPDEILMYGVQKLCWDATMPKKAVGQKENGNCCSLRAASCADLRSFSCGQGCKYTSSHTIIVRDARCEYLKPPLSRNDISLPPF